MPEDTTNTFLSFLDKSVISMMEMAEKAIDKYGSSAWELISLGIRVEYISTLVLGIISSIIILYICFRFNKGNKLAKVKDDTEIPTCLLLGYAFPGCGVVITAIISYKTWINVWYWAIVIWPELYFIRLGIEKLSGN